MSLIIKHSSKKLHINQVLLSFPLVLFLVIYTLNNSSLLCSKLDEMCVALWASAATTCARFTPVSVRMWNDSAICSSWITCTEKHTQTWSTDDKHLNENANLLSVWSWLNILSDLYDYGNHTFDFSRGRESVEPNRLSRLGRFDISWNTSKDDFFFFDHNRTNTHDTGCDLCTGG